jgi:SAM-dependent methyltransferase
MIIPVFKKIPILRKIIYCIGKSRATELVDFISPFLNKKESILDIGSGTCNVCEILINDGHQVTPLDTQDLSFVESIKPTIYCGYSIPFPENQFDTALILTVLHHTPEPELILKNVREVSKKIVIVEDVYTNWLNKQLTFFFDSLVNIEFWGHPHTNKTDAEWREVFQKLGFKIIDSKYQRSLWVFQHAAYYLQKID